MPVMAKKKPPTTSVYIRIPVDLKEALEALADEERRQFSVEACIAIERHLEAKGKWPSPAKRKGSKHD